MSSDAVESSNNPQWVFITGGKKHKGKTLRFIRFTPQKVCVQREDGKEIFLNPEHVDLNRHASSPPTTTTKPATSPAPTDAPKWVRIVRGKHKGKVVQYIRHTKQRISVKLEQGKVIHLLPEHVHMDGVSSMEPPQLSTLEIAVVPPSAPKDPVDVVLDLTRVEATSPGPATEENEPDDEPDFEDYVTAKEEDSYDFVSEAEELSAIGQDRAQVSNSANNIPNKSQRLTNRDQIVIQRGKYQGETVTFVKRTKEHPDDPKIKYLLPTYLDAPEQVFASSDENDRFVQAIRRHLPQSVHVSNVTPLKVNHTLFGAIFGRDAAFFEMSTSKLSSLPRQFSLSQDCTYFIAAVKLHDKAKSLTSHGETIPRRSLRERPFDALSGTSPTIPTRVLETML